MDGSAVTFGLPGAERNEGHSRRASRQGNAPTRSYWQFPRVSGAMLDAKDFSRL